VEVAPILELIIRDDKKNKIISLEGAEHESAVWKYVRPNSKAESVKKEDLTICGTDEEGSKEEEKES
ncbi:MAG: hypothetical protein WBE34_07160, partial [Candidatus Nitrosopolaris sp.]